MSGLVGKSVIVTGSSSGIGEQTAILFASKGSHVTLCGRDSGRLQDAVEKCRRAAREAGHGDAKFISVLGDLKDASVRTEVVSKTVDTFGKLDVLVCNHAVALANDTVENITEDTFDTIVSTNLKSGVFLVQKAVPHLELTKGSVVCVSSIARHCCTKNGLFTYSLAKSALEHAVRALALDLGPKGIRVNCINPTFNKTRIFRDMFPDPAHLDAFEEMYSKATPLAGRVSTTENPASAILFLASDAAKFMSGGALLVDGGILCKGNPPNFVD